METEKASVEVPATAAGTVTEIHVNEGDTLGANAAIVTLDTTEGETAAAEPQTEPEPVSEEEQPDTGTEEPRAEGAEAQAGRPAEAPDTPSTEPPVLPAKSRGIIPAAPTVRRFAREIGA